MDQASLIARLREDFGFSSTTDFPDAKLITLINYALVKISEIYPKILRDYINTVVGQTRYSITKTGLLGIKEVFYSREEQRISPFPVGSTFQNSRSMTGIMELEIATKLDPIGSEVVGHDTFDLIPTPEEVQKVYYDYKVVRALSELPSNFEDDILDLIAFRNSEMKFKKSVAYSGAAGNPFKFDRRGNITEEPSSMIIETQTAMKTQLDTLLSRIHAKVNRM